MTKKEQIFALLGRMGYKPDYDEDGDITLMYQLKQLYFITNDDEDDKFVQLLFPQFHRLNDDEETKLALFACNKVTCESKLVKVYIDKTFTKVSASVEFYYTDDESLQMNVEKSLGVIGITRSAFEKSMKELSD